MKIKVLQIITDGKIGGAERIVAALCSHMVSSRIDTSVIVLGKCIDAFREETNHGRAIWRLQLTKNIRELPRLIGNAWHAANCMKPDVIHAHMYHALIFALLIKALRPRVKLIFTLHNKVPGSAIRRLIIRLTRHLRSVDVVFDDRSRFEFNTEKVVVIPNCYIERSSGNVVTGDNIKVEGRYRFLSVGSLTKQKNHRSLIPILAKLASEFDVEWLIAGEGVERESLQQLIEQHNIAGRVRLRGNIDNVEMIMKESNCLVHPSLWEGMPLVLFEAAANSLTILTTRVGSVASIFNDSEVIISPINKFEKHMRSLVAGDIDQNGMEKRARERVIRYYGLGRLLVAHERLYSDVILVN